MASMHQRKAEMARHSDAFIALPGLLFLFLSYSFPFFLFLIIIIFRNRNRIGLLVLLVFLNRPCLNAPHRMTNLFSIHSNLSLILSTA